MSFELKIDRNSSVPLHEQLYEELRRAITKLPPDTRLPSENALCRRYSLSRLTIARALNSLTEKGYILADDSGAVTLYSPLIRRDDALLAETESILDRVYKGSVSMMLSAVTQKQNLTGEEIAELYEILRRAEEESMNR